MKIHLPASWLWIQLALLFMFINIRTLRTYCVTGPVHTGTFPCVQKTKQNASKMMYNEKGYNYKGDRSVEAKAVPESSAIPKEMKGKTAPACYLLTC